MSQRSVEAALGKLVCDDGFRRDFYRDAEAAAVRAGLQLTRVELNSLRTLNRSAIDLFASQLDDRVRRAEAPGPRVSR